MERTMSADSYDAASGKDITALNNAAVKLIRGARDDEALSMLSEAFFLAENYLRSTKSDFAASQNRDLFQTMSLDSLETLCLGLISAPKPLFESVIADEESSATKDVLLNAEVSTSPSNCFTIFNRAFVLGDYSTGQYTLSQFRYLSHVSAVLLFNIAFVHHRIGVKEGSSKAFAKAHEIYSMSLFLLEETALMGMYSSQFNLLLLALFNQLGHIESHFFNTVQTVRYREQMLAIFIVTDCTRLLSKEDYIFFYMSLLFSINRWPALAPAA